MYKRLGRVCYQHRVIVVFIWIALLAGSNVAAWQVGESFNSEFDDRGSESDQGFAILKESFPQFGGGSLAGSIVFQADEGVASPSLQAEMEAVFAEVETMEGVSVTSPYSEFGQQQVSADGQIAFAQVNLESDIDQTEAGIIGGKIEELLPEERAGLRTEIGGAALSEFEPPETELIGLAFAVVILILAFGSVMAMGLPIGVALAGVGTGAAITTLLTNVTTVPDFAPLIGIMIGLGVGIDYALFIVTRYREGMRAGLSSEEATVAAMDTAGRADVFAGLTVVASLLGMLLIGLSFISGLGIAASMTVAVTMVAAITLLPALLGFARERVEVTRWLGLIVSGLVSLALFSVGIGVVSVAAVVAPVALVILVVGLLSRWLIPLNLNNVVLKGLVGVASIFKPLHKKVPPRVEKPVRETLAYRWSRIMQARPWVFLVIGGGLLLVLSAPVLSLRLGFSDEGNRPEETTARQAYDLIAEGFGPGFNGPLLVASTVEDPADGQKLVELAEAIQADPGVASVAPPFPDNVEDPSAATAYLLQVIPETSPQDEATEQTVKRLRESVIPPVVDGTTIDANVTGVVPANIDFSSYLSSRSLLFFGVVLVISFVLLMAVFRSLLVPLKAVIMNMLSISAAYGVVVALFQWGWFGSVTGIEPAPIEPFVPMMMFAIVFGLSMDYEVFLLSRVKEEFDRTGDAVNSVADGLASTARVITAAAAIMVVVFGSFLLEDDRVIKLFGVGLSMAVLLDASLVRMLLVPATMELLGKRNWWLPKWVDRIVPTLNVEGGEPASSVQPLVDTNTNR